MSAPRRQRERLRVGVAAEQLHDQPDEQGSRSIVDIAANQICQSSR